MSKTLKIVYYGPFGQPTGYARAMHDNLMALRTQKDVELWVSPMFAVDTDQYLEPMYQPLVEFATRKPPAEEDVTHVLVHTMPLYASRVIGRPPRQAQRVCLTTWETDHIPLDCIKSLASFDKVFVPSDQVLAALPPDLDARVIPHAYNHEFWCVEPEESVSKNSKYTFYAISNIGSRKNVAGILTAYLSEFTAEDNVQLIIHAPSFSHESLDHLRTAMYLPPNSYPPVIVQTERLSHDELRAFHRRCHCYVSSSRGEAWELGAFEAAAVGNATIVPSIGGQQQYLHKLRQNKLHHVYPSSWTPAVPMDEVETRPVRIGDSSMRLNYSRRVAPSGVTAKQLWGNPDLAKLRGRMRATYRQHNRMTQTDLRTLALRSSTSLAVDFNYNKIGEKFVEALRDDKQ